MNIVYTLPDLHFGGTANLLLQNVEYISRFHNVTILYFGKNDLLKDRFEKTGVKIERIKYNGIHDISSTISTIRKFIKHNSVEIVHCNLYLDKVLMSVATIGMKVTTIGTIHSAETSRYQRTWKLRLNFLIENFTHHYLLDHTIAVSKASKESAVAERGIKESKIRLIYNGIAALTESKDSLKDENKGIIFATACRFIKIKGLSRLVKTFSLLNEYTNNWHLYLIGDGALKETLIQEIKQYNLEDKITITGFTDNVAYYLNLTDYYVNSSFSEAMPISVLEAMSLGKPIFASNVGGLPEIISEGQNGFLVDFNITTEASEKVYSEISKSNEHYKSLSATTKALFDKRFSTEKYYESLMTLYNEEK